MADLRVTSEMLKLAAAEFASSGQQLRDGLSALDGEVAQVLGSSWTGDASSAYDKVWREWHEGGAKVLEGLATMSELLVTAAAGYTGIDRSGASAIDEAGL